MPNEKKILKNQLKQQKKQFKAQDLKNELENAKLRSQALKEGRPVPYGAQEKADWRHSTGPTPTSIKTTTPEQQQILQNLYQVLPQGINNLNLPGNQSNFAPIEAQARQNFNQNTVPSLAERFTSLGSGNALSSPAFAQQLGQSARGFETDLAALKAQYGLAEQSQQSNNVFNSLGAFLSPQFDYGIDSGRNSGVRNAFEGLKSLLPTQIGVGPVSVGWGANSASGNAQPQQQYTPITTNGSGIGMHSSGFEQAQQSQLSTKQLAGAGYPMPDLGNPGAFNLL